MDMETVAQDAKQVLLKNGELPLCIFVELDHSQVIIVGIVNEGTNVYERSHLKFLAGRAFALKAMKKFKKRSLAVTGVCEACEVWFAGPSRLMKPSMNPDRREGLSIASLDVQTKRQKQALYEILRDGAGTLDLLKMHDGHEEVEIYGPGLPAFLAGVQTAKQDYSLAIHEVRRLCERYAIDVQRSIELLP